MGGNSSSGNVGVRITANQYKTIQGKTVKSSNKIIIDNNNNKNKNKNISIGINIGASKSVYSIFSIENGKFVSEVLLMNRSSRIIPSIICYTKDHRLFGETSKSSLKQNLSTSYNNLSRIIGFDNSNLFIEELKYMYINNTDIKNFKFYCKENSEKKEEIISEFIIADFLSLINEYYYKEHKSNVNTITISLSIPDFYTSYQRQQLKLICESIGMKDIKLFNESSAITMYYGYTKYKDIFLNKEKKIDQNIEKNILFIDIGHSKTSFILSKFKYNEFKVEYIDYLINIGGRDFDNLLFNFCIDNFKKINNLKEVEINPRMKYRLFEIIKIKRIQLSINDEAIIIVESFYENNDLEVKITQKEFEKLIEKKVAEIKKVFENILSKYKEIKIDKIEMAGELMRTPILQKMIEDKNFKVSKTILIDECTSVGASLLDFFFTQKKNFPIKQLNNFIELNNQKKIENEKKNEELINKIKEHIDKFNKIDKEYNEFIEYKNTLLKNIYILNEIIYNNEDKNNIKILEKKIRTIKNEKKSLLKIDNELKQIAISIIDDLNKKSEINDKYKFLFEEMKKKELFPYSEFEKKYKELNLK